jgi:hypothetical protein
MSRVNEIWGGIRDRLKEPSTWAAVTMPLVMFGVLTQEEATVVATAGEQLIEGTSGSSIELNLGIIGGAVSALLGIFLPENRK